MKNVLVFAFGGATGIIGAKIFGAFTWKWWLFAIAANVAFVMLISLFP